VSGRNWAQRSAREKAQRCGDGYNEFAAPAPYRPSRRYRNMREQWDGPEFPVETRRIDTPPASTTPKENHHDSAA